MGVSFRSGFSVRSEPDSADGRFYINKLALERKHRRDWGAPSKSSRIIHPSDRLGALRPIFGRFDAHMCGGVGGGICGPSPNKNIFSRLTGAHPPPVRS